MTRGSQLQEYDSDIQQKLSLLLKTALENYIGKTREILEIALNVKSCDSILQDMADSLTAFQQDLALVSKSIEHIQAEAEILETRLGNRMACIYIYSLTTSEHACLPARSIGRSHLNSGAYPQHMPRGYQWYFFRLSLCRLFYGSYNPARR